MSSEFNVSHLTNNKTSINTPNKSKSANLNKLTIERKKELILWSYDPFDTELHIAIFL